MVSIPAQRATGVDEPGSDAARATFLAGRAREAAEILAGEMKRRARKAAKAEDESDAGDPEEPDND